MLWTPAAYKTTKLSPSLPRENDSSLRIPYENSHAILFAPIGCEFNAGILWVFHKSQYIRKLPVFTSNGRVKNHLRQGGILHFGRPEIKPSRGKK
jgi:hypothetical protein